MSGSKQCFKKMADKDMVRTAIVGIKSTWSIQRRRRTSCWTRDHWEEAEQNVQKTCRCPTLIIYEISPRTCRKDLCKMALGHKWHHWSQRPYPDPLQPKGLCVTPNELAHSRFILRCYRRLLSWLIGVKHTSSWRKEIMYFWRGNQLQLQSEVQYKWVPSLFTIIW